MRTSSSTTRSATSARAAARPTWCSPSRLASCRMNSSRRWLLQSLSTTLKRTRTDVRLWILSDTHLELTRGSDLPPPAARPALGLTNVAVETMNDYRKIRTRNYELRLRPAHTLKRHMESRDFIAHELRKGGRHVVVTHHGPVPEAARRGFERDISSAAYTSDLHALIREGAPELWVYGNTHESRDFTVGATRLITNANVDGPW